MPKQDSEAGDEIIGDAIPEVPEKRRVIRPDLSEPWYRPAKQFLRRQQWNACILQLLNKLGKHATAVFSGQVPSTIEFLQPEKTLEKNTDSLRDFIIALDKSKADKLRNSSKPLTP